MNLPKLAGLQQPGGGVTQRAVEEAFFCFWKHFSAASLSVSVLLEYAHTTMTSKTNSKVIGTTD